MCADDADMEAAEKSLARGIEWLLAQQAKDGGWHSKSYGQLKDGAGITALILHALSLAPEPLRQQSVESIDKAFAFLEPGLVKRGTIASPDGSLDFPTYASAMWLSANHRMGRREGHRPVVDYILGA